MSTAPTRFRKTARLLLETGGLVILITLLALPFTRAFADDYRYGRGGPPFVAGSTVEGWRLGGGFRKGGYEIWRWYRGGWRRMPGRGVQLGGNPNRPFVINTDGERYQWTGRDWRFVGYAGGRGFNRRGNPPPVFFNDRGRNHWNDYRGNRRAVVRQQRNRIDRQQDRIRDLRRDLRQERAEDRREDRRDRIRRENRRDRAQDGRQDRRDGARNRRDDRPGNNGRQQRRDGPR